VPACVELPRREGLTIDTLPGEAAARRSTQPPMRA